MQQTPSAPNFFIGEYPGDGAGPITEEDFKVNRTGPRPPRIIDPSTGKPKDVVSLQEWLAYHRAIRNDPSHPEGCRYWSHSGRSDNNDVSSSEDDDATEVDRAGSGEAMGTRDRLALEKDATGDGLKGEEHGIKDGSSEKPSPLNISERQSLDAASKDA